MLKINKGIVVKINSRIPSDLQVTTMILTNGKNTRYSEGTSWLILLTLQKKFIICCKSQIYGDLMCDKIFKLPTFSGVARTNIDMGEVASARPLFFRFQNLPNLTKHALTRHAYSCR